ncbi:MAG: TOBE domain-containing protein, partial [Actinomycetota bacterium]|nr:TOBE domain-containing protein [Actinomycetota bacterium]
QLRGQIRKIQQETGTTTLLVTHDQEEALTMADRVGVMANGRIDQLGTPDEIYHHPRTAFVSEFVGVVNRVPATVDGSGVVALGRRLDIANDDFESQGAVEALIRPEDLHVEPAADGIGTVTGFTLRGPVTSLELSLEHTGQVIRVDLPSPAAAKFHASQRVSVLPSRGSAVVDVVR